MSPTAHWSPDDYYRASRAARRAWQARDSQLVLGLDDQDVARADGFGCGVLIVEPVGTHPLPAAGSTSSHTTAPVAGLPQDLRDRSQEGV